MIIRSMTASFGTLNGEQLTLGEGLNIIYAPNERGKSTWCAFIKAMLYGIDSTQRVKAGVRPDKVKYLPWSGAPMEGTMVLTKGGRDIRITRRTRTASAPMREFSAVYADSGEPIPELTGSDAGLMLVGESRAVFERSAFIRQAGIDVTGSPELEKRITALLSSGEEDTSYTEADERLRAWLRKRQYNKYGRIPELDAAISEKKVRLEEMRDTIEVCRKLEAAAEELEARKRELSHRVEESRKKQRRQVLETLSAGRAKVQTMEKELEDCRLEEDKHRRAARETIFGDMPLREAEAKAKTDRERAHALLTAARRPVTPILWILCLMLALVCSIAGAFVSWYIYAGSAVFLAAGVYLLFDFFKKKDAASIALGEADEILARYEASQPQDITGAYQRYEALCKELDEAVRRREDVSSRLEALREQRKQEDARLLQELDFSGGSSEAAELGRILAQTEDRLQRLREQWAMTDGKLKAMGDPLQIQTDIETMLSQRAVQQEQYDAIALAIEVLREANTQMRNRFSPRLSRKATAFMAALTDGSYDELIFDREMSVKARRKGDLDGYDGDFFSIGTKDQIYLALRLAICELTGDEENLCPLILDDALVNFDEERMGRALSLLREIGKRRQVLLFTCHRREIDYFEADNGVTILEL